jgi:wobble nucleotide-excising tRNase
MALTLRDITDEEIELFRNFTSERTATKALVKAAHIGVTATNRYMAAEKKIKTLELTLQTYQQAISRLNGACIQVAELAAQSDLFDQAPGKN